ncbi:MAG: amino acid permease [Gemmatimonadota bacterium]
MATALPHLNTAPDRLVRRLGLFSATNLVVANMVGAGIFTTSGLLLGELGSPLVMLALWVAGGVLALAGALCYGELGAAMPSAGGEYVYLGRLYHPVLGFLTGWVSFLVGFSAPLAASALGCSEYFASAFPFLLPPDGSLLPRKLFAVLLVAGLTAVHLRGMRTGARVQNVLTVGKVLLIVALIVAGAALGQGDLGHLTARAAPVAEAAGTDRFSWHTVGLALMWIMFAYSGWNASAYVGSEIRDPARNLPRSLLAGTGLVLLLYVGLNLLFVYAVPPAEMGGVIAVGGLAAHHLFGGAARTVVSGLIAFALLSSISALIILGPRVYFAMARDGFFFRAVAEVQPSTRVPAKSILLQSGIAIVLILSGTFEQILTYMGFCLGIFPILAVLGLFRLRRSHRPGYHMPGFPAVPVFFATASLSILVLAFQERPAESSVAILTVVAGLPFYLLFNRSRQARLADDAAEPAKTPDASGPGSTLTGGPS